MRKHIDMVKKFMHLAHQRVPSTPSVPSTTTLILRASLILEEALETINAMGLRVEHNAAYELKIQDLSFYPKEAPNLVEIADGIADLSVVSIGTALACGIDMAPIIQEVDQNNLDKFKGSCSTRADGKVIKPKDHRAPNIYDLLAKHKIADLPLKSSFNSDEEVKCTLLNRFRGDPRFRDEDGNFHFWDETWAHSYGPFETEEECNLALSQYADYASGDWVYRSMITVNDGSEE